MNSQKTAREFLSDDEIEKQARERVILRNSKPKPLTAEEKKILGRINSKLEAIIQRDEEKAIEREIILGACNKINEKSISKCMKCKIKQIAEKNAQK